MAETLRSLDDLRAQVTADQRNILNIVLQHYLENDSDPWIPAAILYHRLGKGQNEQTVHATLQSLGGTVIYKSADHGNDRHYVLPFLGMLLTDQGREIESVFAKALECLRDQYLKDYSGKFNGKKAAEELGLIEAQLHLLLRIFSWSHILSSGGGIEDASWPPDMDKLVPAEDFKTYIQEQELKKFDPSVLVDSDPLVRQYENRMADNSIFTGFNHQEFVVSHEATEQNKPRQIENESPPNPRRVFIVYGRNVKAYQAMVQFLRSLKLDPLEFDEVKNAMGGSPFVGEIVDAGIRQAQAVIVIFTPDEYASLRKELIYDGDPDYEKNRWQARPNVILEAGMALAIDQSRTILVMIGDVHLSSDLHGRHYIKLNNSTHAREKLKHALIGAKCEVSPTASGWHDPAIAGDFEACILPPAPPTVPQTSAIEKPIVRLEFANLEDRRMLGGSILLRTVNHAPHQKHRFPDKEDPDRFGLSSLTSNVNPEFWRELADYTRIYRVYSPAGLATTNISETLIKRVRLQIEYPENGALSFSGMKSMPDYPASTRYSWLGYVSQPASKKVAPLIEKYGDRWVITVEFGDVQPHATSWAAEPILIAANTSGHFSLTGQIYADNISPPQAVTIELNFEVESRPSLIIADLEQVDEEYKRQLAEQYEAEEN